ncbi:hypothetical protein AB1L30_14390 [Bremerella sp. JC817]|uniref:hypothetical protein n=1 Tax=Bremerella sp. JC817 TaxID=3231756 RepID=UPI0034596CE0
MKRTKIPFLTTLCLVLIAFGGSLAMAQTSTFNQRQTSHVWKSKHGNFQFNGKATKKEGNYVTFRTTDNFEITLPVKYLSDEDLAYLKYLEGSGPLPPGITAAAGSSSPGTTPPTGGMANNAGPSTDDTAMNEGTTDPAEPMPTEPETGDPTQSYAPGASVDVMVDGKWYPGRVIVVRPSDNHYYVTFNMNGQGRPAWIAATELRPQKAATTSDTSPMPGSSDEPLESFDFKGIPVTAKQEIGYDVGPMREGDTLKLRYVSGKWKSWGNLASESPDADAPAGGDKVRMAICSISGGNQVQTLTLVPGGTADTPFTWQADKDYEKIILQINDPDKTFADNPERGVTYAIAIERAGS